MPILFTCAPVLSRLVVKGGYMRGTLIVGTNSKIMGGPGQTKKTHVEESWQGAQSNPRTRPGWTFSQGASRKWPLNYVQSIQ
jgi:hypothetical protein